MIGEPKELATEIMAGTGQGYTIDKKYYLIRSTDQYSAGDQRVVTYDCSK